MRFWTRIITKKEGSNCQRHPTNLLTKQPKTTTPRLHAITTLSNISEENIKKILFSLDNIKVAGMDQFRAKFLRDFAVSGGIRVRIPQKLDVVAF